MDIYSFEGLLENISDDVKSRTKSLAKEFQSEVINPHCDKYKLTFIQSLNDYFFLRQISNDSRVYIHSKNQNSSANIACNNVSLAEQIYNDCGLGYIFKILDHEIVPGNKFGNWMKTYSPDHTHG